ncbi:AtzG-like protein [Novosphingobium sp. Rr 2-17]|uniref:AtzG-like protein n=1 Tax=Novosphingobium sp. Rr 2-17 TaxID=555793 RepID=UPI0012F6EE79|nr:AtzG-like protein [Novosphingobium sp. Rr 2-17]
MSDAPPLSAAVPLTPEEVAAASTARGLPIPSACQEGVAANLALLARHAATMRGRPAT